jgi:hypothetical protein
LVFCIPNFPLLRVLYISSLCEIQISTHSFQDQQQAINLL